ncbi:hypothetical protein [Thermosulfurimonas sp. F29]|uniref:hypothetical protein n=1 Tax=Thermosulfurimonas sp. F29 TaxID=2867247 RepID=UPI001C8395F9|nr:hypothetical protein [Thermosulfurimonas sp. F29]MBX6423407.1 hypothetical protein [Thermosulfurimonas sp. F29]
MFPQAFPQAESSGGTAPSDERTAEEAARARALMVEIRAMAGRGELDHESVRKLASILVGLRAANRSDLARTLETEFTEIMGDLAAEIQKILRRKRLRFLETALKNIRRDLLRRGRRPDPTLEQSVRLYADILGLRNEVELRLAAWHREHQRRQQEHDILMTPFPKRLA